MGGGLMQLVAYGAQDIYLTGNPQITFFKVVYRRHTNFAVEAIEQTFNGSSDLGRKFTCTIARNGDLLHRVYLQASITATNPELEYLGFQLIDYVEVEIGGQVIDKQYGEWMAVWCDLTHSYDQSLMLDSMVSISNETLYIPLQFWFCRNAGLALPLIALQYHEVKLNVQMKSSVSGVSAIESCSVWCDYVFLDTDERRRFAQVSHEYLIEQVQFSNELSVSTSGTQQELRFNHPVKELVWLVKGTGAGLTNYKQCGSALLQLNGQDRFKRRHGHYFTKVQRYEHHTGAGHSLTGGSALESVHVYSFGLKPEEHQPSGTCNFSRIDNAVLNIADSSFSTSDLLKVYAVNYNVLRIMSGMGGLAYSN
jgi:hypothetical protein